MFGGFSLYWNNRCLTGGVREGDSQIVRLLGAVIHSGKKGLSRADLEEILFEGHSSTDISHGIRTVLYNTKKKLEKEGLPAVNYIQSRDGFYFWNEEIPVIEDAREFEKLCLEAQKEEDPDVCRSLYAEAISFYSGDFLPLQGRMVWVQQEDKRYGGIFADCVRRDAHLLRKNGDYNQLESLGKYAVKVQPFMGWEELIIEAFSAQGREDEAVHLYELTEQLYMSELGVKPFLGNTRYLEKLGDGLNHHYAGLGTICKTLSGAGEEMPGGFMCSYPVFRGIYRMAERISERDGHSFYFMLCTILGPDKKPLQEGKTLKTLSPKLADAICHSVRRSDAVCRYGDGQFLILLANITREDCAIVQKRIDRRFTAGKSGGSVEYFCSDVTGHELLR